MRPVRLVLRLSAAAAVLIAAVLAGGAIRQARDHAGPPTSPSDASGALTAASGKPSASTGAAVCLELAAVTQRSAPPLSSVELGDGTQRVTSAEGGYAIVLPSDWRISPSLFGPTNPNFGQLHATSYDANSVPRPDPEGSMLPPSVGISVDIQVWLNPAHEPLARYASRIQVGPDQAAILPGMQETIDGREAYAFTINDKHQFMQQDGTVIVTTQTRLVWLIQSGRDDRVIVAYATPGENDLAALVARAVRSMSVTAPSDAARPVVHQREEVVRQWLYDKTGAPIAGRHAEAKLLTYDEAGAALDPRDPGRPNERGLLRIDHDPDDLYWIVAVSGPGLPEPSGPYVPGGAPPRAATTWMLFDTPATDAPPGSTGMSLSNGGAWPPGFDALPDRCR